MTLIYSRYGTIYTQYENYSLQDAIDLLTNLEDNGDCYALGIYDDATQTMHLPDNMNVFGVDKNELLQSKMQQFKTLKLQIHQCKTYERKI